MTATLPLEMGENEITGLIVNACIRIHRRLGPGLLESVYEQILTHELRKLGVEVLPQEPIPLCWDDLHFDRAFQCDLLVHRKVIVELKSVESISTLHRAKLLTYLKLADKRVGLLVNFSTALMKDGIERIMNKGPSLF
jgi:GxxExxY protein